MLYKSNFSMKNIYFSHNVAQKQQIISKTDKN